mgnify:CR=1 FL=1
MKTMKLNNWIIIVTALFTTINLSAQNYYTTQDGNWQTKGIWLNNNDPGTGWINWKTDTIFINHNVTFNQSLGVEFVVIVSSSGSITGNSDFTISNNGELKTNGGFNINNLTVQNAGEAILNGNTTINNNLNQTGNNSSITNNGNMTVNGNTNLQNQSYFTNNDTITLNGTFLNNTTTVTNTGTWNSNNDLTSSWHGTFNNSGEIVITNGKFTNNGQFNNEVSGYLEISGDFYNHWDVVIENNGNILIGGSYSSNSLINGNGSICSLDGTTDPTGGDHSSLASTITICSATDQTPFPVEFVEFEATKTDGHIALSWTTASESNNDYFTIERAIGNNEFISIATIEGAGNSNKTMHYNYTDFDVAAGETMYYRIKQTDYDGQASYSWIQEVTFNNRSNVSIYPNPAQNGENITIESAEKNVVKIYDAHGSVIYSRKTNQNNVSIPTDDFKPGLYFIRLENKINNNLVTRKLIIR